MASKSENLMLVSRRMHVVDGVRKVRQPNPSHPPHPAVEGEGPCIACKVKSQESSKSILDSKGGMILSCTGPGKSPSSPTQAQSRAKVLALHAQAQSRAKALASHAQAQSRAKALASPAHTSWIIWFTALHMEW